METEHSLLVAAQLFIEDEKTCKVNYRASNVFIGDPAGGVRVNPPPFEVVDELILDWLRVVNELPVGISPREVLLAASYLMWQFLIIHPLNNGNGRFSAVLFDSILLAKGRMRVRPIYAAWRTQANRSAQTEKIHRVATDGEWREWVEFILSCWASACLRDDSCKGARILSRVGD